MNIEHTYILAKIIYSHHKVDIEHTFCAIKNTLALKKSIETICAFD